MISTLYISRLTQINPGLGTLKGIIFCFQPGDLKYDPVKNMLQRNVLILCNVERQAPHGKISREQSTGYLKHDPDKNNSNKAREVCSGVRCKGCHNVGGKLGH